MIHFDPVPEPPTFDEKARKPGDDWLASNLNAKRPKDFWSAFRGDLATGFRDLCAYSAMYEPVGTVDHFISWNEDHSKAYDWSNYRYASGWISSRKKMNLLKSSSIHSKLAMIGLKYTCPRYSC
jgi:hypothetical protein